MKGKMNKYTCIAISAIWIGVGLSAQAGEVVGLVAVMGFFGTLAVVSRG